MVRFIIIGLASGILFWLLEAIINANPYAQNLYQAYKPILKTTLNIPLVLLIYILFGFAMAGIFLFFYTAFPGTGIVKGISFAVLVWFFRGFMGALSQWMTFAVPSKALVYAAITGLIESVLVGMLYGVTLKV